jgi:hypothetical protein
MSRQSAIDMVGFVSGYLTVIRRAGSKSKANGKSYATWLCRCTCGEEAVVIGQHLRNGRRKACAKNHYWATTSETTLGRQFPSEYGSWRSARERCTLKNKHNWAAYGGRGIKFCSRWNSFAAFLEDMGPKPDPELTIERNDVNGHYEPDNCRWATRAEQYRNMQRTVYVTYEGERMLFIDLIARLGLNRMALYGRLKNGWSLEEALALPIRPKKPNRPKQLDSPPRNGQPD